MKRLDPRIIKTFNNKFSQQYFIKLYDSNFKFIDFVGFKKFKSNVWGEKNTLLHVNKLFSFFSAKIEIFDSCKRQLF